MPFIRLIRPVNLFIIMLTMLSVRLLFFMYYGKPVFTRMMIETDFFLLIFSTVLIAAAGNIINDYFDVRADRVNRPQRLIITRTIKRRWAIILHWLFNFVAFGIAAYLSYREQTFWYVFIDLLSINLLWFYSMYFKRKAIIGNVIIALLTALVPVLAAIYFHINLSALPEHTSIPYQFLLLIIGAVAIFAFCLNLSREIIKDIEDVKGDMELKAKTLPILKGSKFAAIVAVLPVMLLVLAYVAGFFVIKEQFHLGNLSHVDWMIAALPLNLSCLLNIFIIGWIIVYLNNTQKLILSEKMLKLSMLLGLLLPFYMYLIH